jgi:hypothetical protein
MAKGILRPLDYGGIFDEMFDLYKKHFVLFVGIGAVIYVPLYAIAYAFGGNIASGIGSILALLLSSIVVAASTHAVSQCYLGKKTTIADSYKAVARRMFLFVLTWFVAGVFLILGMIPLFIVCIILSFRYTFISQVFVLEGKVGKEARVRSAWLVKGNVGRIFVLGLLAGLLTTAISSVLMAPAQALAFFLVMQHGPQSLSGPIGVLYGVILGVASALSKPLELIAFILLYYDIRIRKEGFDIEMLANNMGVSAPVAVETPVPAAVTAGSEVEARPAMPEPEAEAGSATPEPEAQAGSESPQP